VNEAKLRQLLKIFQESDVEELELHHSFWSGTRIRICRRNYPPPAPEAATVHATPAVRENLGEAAPVEAAPVEAAASEELHVVPSPMVGTFYRATSPEAEPFVREGDRVKPGQTLCIIEAMKIMNEISSDLEGEVVEILVDDAIPVEFSQPLMKIRPS